MNELHEKLMLALNEIGKRWLSRGEALQLLIAGELSRLNDRIGYLKRAAGNIDDTLG